MEDLAGLLFPHRVHDGALALSQGLQSAQCKGRIHWKRHFRSPERIATEQGHEPGRSGGDDHPFRMARVLDSQRSQVVVASPQSPLDGTVAHLQCRNLRHPLLTAPVTRRHFARRRMDKWGLGACAVARGHNIQSSTPLPIGRNDYLKYQPFRCGFGPIRLDDDALPDVVPCGLDFQGVAVVTACLRPATLDSCLFHFEQVGEVRFDGQHNLAFNGLRRVVADGDPFPDPCPTSRSRSTINGLSAYPSESCRRPAKRARYGSFVSAAKGSRGWPLMVRFQRKGCGYPGERPRVGVRDGCLHWPMKCRRTILQPKSLCLTQGVQPPCRHSIQPLPAPSYECTPDPPGRGWTFAAPVWM
ncbi:hypothetical protein AHiyo8_07550 [Arthrobacter sp. Hiyo8]|nr:hypothetical protein AHiyo8_07550 [Arthrobacter sp. Hiyo8]